MYHVISDMLVFMAYSTHSYTGKISAILPALYAVHQYGSSAFGM